MELLCLAALDLNSIEDEMTQIGVSEAGISIMIPKFKFYIFKVSNISGKSANILKQNMLSAGGEVAVSAEVASFNPDNTTVLISGTAHHFRKLCPRLRQQPFGLKRLAELLEAELALEKQP